MKRRNRRLMVVVCFTIATLGGGRMSGQGTAVPSPWASRDIGSPAIPGASSFDQASGTFSIDAAGADIWGTADQFHFVYQPLAGDAVITARVDKLAAVHSWSKAGVMIRSSLNANAAHAYALVSGGNGAAFQRRRSDGGTSVHTSGSTGAAPLWVRLVRSGATVTASVSSNGTSWTTIGSDTIALGATAYVGLAVTSHNVAQSTSAAVSSVTATRTGALPSPQQSQDIGSPAIAGSAAFSQGTYTVTAAGRDISDTADQFHYVYQPLTGDMDASIRVVSFAGLPPQAKAGVMIRENLTSGSPHALAALSRDSGYLFQRRPAAGGTTVMSTAVAGAPPGWVRLRRTGDLITAYRSLDGTTWTAMGSDSFPMAATVYVGIAVTSRDVSAATTATLSNLVISQSLPPNQPPAATLSAPVTGATYTAPATIAVTASASDADGTVARVDFYNGTTLLASDTTAPYAITWSNVAAGTYTLRATAVDDAGASGSSATATVTVTAPANQPPTATLTTPTNGASFIAPATVSLTASASDSDGSVARVDFYNGNLLLGTDASAPYAFTWSNVAAGTYVLKATAVDNAGASGSSATVTITVTGAAIGLVAAYGLNEGTGTIVNDNSGNGLTGVMSGASWIAGRYGQALNLNGTSSVVTFGDVDLTGSLTVMGWMQTRSLYSDTCGSFVMKAYDYGFEVCFGTLMARIGSGTGWSASGVRTLSTADLNVWKHLAMTYDGTIVRFYIDGVLIDSAAGAHVSNNNPLLFGRWTPASEYWDGAVDEVRIYSRTLSQAEVQTDMTAAVNGGPANQAPTATLTGPANGTTFIAPATVSLTASASDPDGTVARVDFYNGSALLGTAASAPYAFTWSNVAAGTYVLKATAVDNAGATGSSADATVTVTAAANQIPTATLTSPANGASFTAPATVSLTASASDPDGTVARVDFYNGSALLGTAASAPYAFTWSNVAAGTYVLKATAVDNAGASGSSATATVTVTAAANQIPTATLTSPANGASFIAPATVSLTASASDPDGTVARVDFYNGSTLLGSDTTAPYTFAWTNVAAGSYALQATAVDNAGASGSSSVASVTVNAANQPPTVTLTAPANGATFTAPATIALAASVSDPENQVNRVEFYRGTTLLGTDTTAPFAFTWSSVPAGTYSLTAVAYDAGGLTGTTAASVSVTVVAASALPPGQQAVDIGGPAIAGSTTYSSGSYQIHAGGADIWNTADQFHYVYQQMSGDIDVSARIVSQSFSDEWAKAGVMIRVALDAASPNVATTLSAGRGYAFQRRLASGSPTLATNVTTGAAPGWVRITRTGALVTAYRSSDGQNWIVIGTDSIDMPNSVYVGIAVTSHNTTVATDAVVDNFRGTAIAPVNQPPAVSLTAPPNGATYTAPASITITATASDADGSVARVDFYNGTILLGSDPTAPYAFEWTNVAAGTYAFKATAVDNVGASGSSATATITVTASANQSPTATLTAPANGASFVAPATVSLTASASDPDGSVARVDFYNGSTLLGSDTIAPYSFTWSNVVAGTYSLKATAVDNAGASGSSSVATVTVSGANQPPTVTLTAPANGATYAAPASLNLTANAADADGSVARVEFYNGGALLGTDTTAPYAFAWSGVPVGSYPLHAVAYDNVGASTTSATATITVAATLPPPTAVVFQASTDHATVTSYLLQIFANGADPNTATPVASSDLGKPTPAANGEITVNRATLFSGLAPGTYLLTVSSIASGGTSRSASVTFTR